MPGGQEIGMGGLCTNPPAPRVYPTPAVTIDSHVFSTYVCKIFKAVCFAILTKSYEENPACRRVEHLKNVIFDDGLRGARVPHLSQTFGESEGPPSGTLVGGVFFETSKFAVSSCNFCTLTELAPLAHGLASLAGTIQKQTRQDM